MPPTLDRPGKPSGKSLGRSEEEGQVSIYISGYEEVLPDFQKEYPEIKVQSVTGRGSQIGQRLIAERRDEKYLADVVSAGGVTTYQQLYVAKVFDPIKPALILPEIIDTSRWFEGRHHYADPEKQYIFSYVGSATYGSVSYNTKLVDAKEFKSYWDLVNPKWKGENYLARYSRFRPGFGQCTAILLPSGRRPIVHSQVVW